MADPILAVYDVKVVLRFNYSTGQYEDYSQPVFPLLMRFDPATTQVEHQYGTPGFSQVPLSAPDPPAGVPLVKSYNLTFHFSALDDSGITYSQLAYASVQWQAAESGDLTRRFLSLQSVLIGLDSPPTISAETFPVHLGMPSLVAHNFSFGGFRQTSDGYTSDSFLYYGDARLNRVESPAPVPEPGTCVLVAGGLALLLRGRRVRAGA